MRLLTVLDNGEFGLVERVGSDIEPYAILSHTWGRDQDEISYKDFVDGTYKNKKSYVKLQFCQAQIAYDELQYFWVDTCNIDKSSSAELTEAINSMYRWYRGAARCYVYLSDVDVSGASGGASQSSRHWRQALRNSRWFKRGWTLQELIAPKYVDFFDLNGEHLGDKESFFQEIHAATSIPREVIRGRNLEDFSVDERLSWAKGRETKREEDAAYSLLGIFDVYMPLIYGEGRKRAFRRLFKELKDLSGNEPSLNLAQLVAQEPRSMRQPAMLASHYSNTVSAPEESNHIGAIGQGEDIALMPMWPGNFLRTKQSGSYLQRRNMMSNAASRGTWPKVIELLDTATKDHGENWSNVVRLSMSPIKIK